MKYNIAKDPRLKAGTDLANEPSTMSRPSGYLPKLGKTVILDAIQTSEPGLISNAAVLRLRQTPHGVVNKQVILETFNWAKVEDVDTLGQVQPSTSFAIDHITARKLIIELANMLDITLTTKLKQRLGALREQESSEEE